MKKCTEPGCGEDAIYSYVWPWGEEGACCSRHQINVQQRAQQLDRQVSFTMIDPNRPKVITRDERSQLIAARLSAEAEITEVKARSAALYESNTKLAEELRRLRAREQVLTAELGDAKGRAEEALEARDKAVADLADAQAEMERLGVLAAASQPPRRDDAWRLPPPGGSKPPGSGGV